ncbi:dihydrofolate reductase [Klebsiella phage KMI9]|jgi:dihydrofolate reductase|uniref:dihydrofolate reductase n=2 Tax=Slopekvirus TaxID=1985328 RepID=A0A7T8EQV4_9CAUD|nr:dihydrofolate reductase [Klebsiella phage KP15]QEG10563.1 dihydrofolate reductase [Klebsiella phage KMI9]QQO91461.1 dihydrofolate reductase [Klebsiella phage vB_KpnM_M1]QYC51190.1 dihydrofolate reductase [Klebsiella phage vB_KpnM-VAC66]UJP30756.1 dihydrofolate reductase [Klebsiella phage Kpn35c1]WDQ26338.1 hypothetical protein phiKPNS3_00071 [Klebsiella phage phi_KPN_S3]BEH83560.1 hypothetical protein [Klebsiella phage phiKp_1]BEH84076.1 hypothetical protein [Klebsiella phage phiKp_4]BEH
MSIVKAVFALGIDIYHDDFAFGYQQGLPWGHCKEDLQNFKEETADSVLIMGANTFTSLPGKLPGRIHCVLSGSGSFLKTKKGDVADYVIHGGGLSAAIGTMQATHPDKNVCVIGGKGLLLDSINNKMVDEVILTNIYGHHVYNAPAFKRDVAFTLSELGGALLKYEFSDLKTQYIKEHERIEKIVVERYKKV